MPDLSEIETSLLSVLAGALFKLPLSTPDGVLLTTEEGLQLFADDGEGYQPPDLHDGPGGNPLRLYRGWPVSTRLVEGVRAGHTHVTVFADTAMARNTTRYLAQDFALSPPAPPTLLLRAIDNLLTVNGEPAAGYLCGVLLGPLGSGVGYSYRVLDGDTCEDVAGALAGQIDGATLEGVVVTMPTDIAVARVVQDVTSAIEVRRQDQVFRLCFWSPSPQIRDVVVAAADVAMARLSRITLASGWSVYVRYHGTRVEDASGQAEVWRRDLMFSVEYPTAATTTTTQMLFGYVEVGPKAPFNA